MTTWYALGTAGAVLFSATLIYVLVVWRRSPKASRAMKLVAMASLSAGMMIGLFGGQVTRSLVDELSGIPRRIWHSNPCAPNGLPASDLGKAIVLENQRHIGDPDWLDIMQLSGLCSLENNVKNNPGCLAYFLARHAIGLDASVGDSGKCIPYEEVAEMCGLGNPAKDSPFCRQAFDFQRQMMKP